MISRSGEDVVKEVSSRLLMRSFMIESVVKEVSYHLLVLTSSIARRFMQFLEVLHRRFGCCCWASDWIGERYCRVVV